MKKIKLNLIKHIGKNKIKYIFISLFLGSIFWYGYSCISEKVCEVDAINRFVRHDLTLTMPNGVLVAEVVDTKPSRELGLSGREYMRDDEGMLFVFDLPGRYGFWMKDMAFPLDIVWINQNGVVVKIEPNFTPESYKQNPPKTAINDPEANYVLEINAGRAEKYGLFLGSKIKISE